MGYETYQLLLYGLSIGAVVITLIASLKVKRAFSKYNKVLSARGITSTEVAERILSDSGIYDVKIEHIRGNLTDHYSPNEKVLRLSDSVINNPSIAAISVAAHECGHAIQHKEEYGPIKLRSFSVPVANIGSKLAWPVIIIGLVIERLNIVYIGIALFLFVIFFQLITLPVEFDASARALKVLENSGILMSEEMNGAKKVLTAAALTYVAALAASVMQLVRILLIASGGGKRKGR